MYTGSRLNRQISGIVLKPSTPRNVYQQRTRLKTLKKRTEDENKQTICFVGNKQEQTLSYILCVKNKDLFPIHSQTFT